MRTPRGTTAIVAGALLASFVVACGSGPASFEGTVVVANAISRDIMVFDAPSYRSHRIPMRGSPHGLAIEPGGARAWVPIQDTNTVEVVDLRQRRRLGSVGVCKAPVDVAFAPEHNEAFVVCDDGYMVVVDSRTLARVGGRVAIGFAPRTIVPGPRGHLWSANRGTNDLSEIDPAANTLVERHPAAPFAYGLAFTPDRRYAFVSSKGWNAIAVIRTEDMEILGSVKVPKDPSGVAVSSDGERVFVASRTGNGVLSIINARTFQKVEQIAGVGRDPEDVAASPDGRVVFVAAYGGGALTVIDADAARVLKRVRAGQGPIAVALA